MELKLDEFLLDALDDAEGDQHHSHFLLADDEVPDLLGELDWEVVEKETDEPLEQPQVVSYVVLLQHPVHVWHLLLQQDPENFAVKSNQGEVVLVKTDRKNTIIDHYLCQQTETFLVIAPRYHQETCREVKALSVAHVREVKSYFPKYLFKPLNIALAAEVGELREGTSNIFSDLIETGVGNREGLSPVSAVRDCRVASHVELVFPHQSIFFSAALLGEIAPLVTAFGGKHVASPLLIS